MDALEPAITTLLGPIQLALRQERARGWLLYDLRGRSVVAARLLSPSGGPRLAWEHRFFYWIPAEGLPVAIAHDDDLAIVPDLPGDRTRYRTAIELRAALEAHVPREGVVLVEQAPFAQIADLAVVDEGTISLLRGRDTQLRSSIELSNRFAGPLSAAEHAEVLWIAGELAELRTMLTRSVGAQPPTSWDALWSRVAAHAVMRGLSLSPESGLALDRDERGQRATSRGGPALEGGATGRIDLWASRSGGPIDVLVPCSIDVGVAPLSEARSTLAPLLLACEEELLRALDERAARPRILGSEVAELAYDALRRRGLRFTGSCVGWALGPVARGSYACTLDAEGFADPRELPVGGAWALRLGVEQDGALAWRTSLFERIEGGIRVIARGGEAPLVIAPSPT